MEKKDHEYCLRCGRKLKNPIARKLGYGLVCYRKQRLALSQPLFDAKVKKDDSPQRGEENRILAL